MTTNLLNGPKPPNQMQIYKPYKKPDPERLPEPQEITQEHHQPPPAPPPDTLPQYNSPPMQCPMFMAPSQPLPYPLQSMVALYPIVPGMLGHVPKGKPIPLPPSDSPVPSCSPIPGVPVTIPIPIARTKPRIVHEYFDQHLCQWKEFIPEDTVVGDGTDPFIVYFRYVNKSIGARRTVYILPKHVKLIKIMQDCLPDLDWRAGEDIFIKAKVLYLRLKNLVEAVEKLKRGESIGPITKTAMEKEKEGEEPADAAQTKETEEKKPVEKEEEKMVKVITDRDECSEARIEPIPDSPSSIKTIVPLSEKESIRDSIPQRPTEAEDSSDATSTDSDIPPTPVTIDEASILYNQSFELGDENIREVTELKRMDLGTALPEIPRITELPEKPDCDDTSSIITEKPTKRHVEPKKFVETETIVAVRPVAPGEGKVMEGFEMLQMVVGWIRKEFSADEEALARQLANKEISYRFLWLYYTPGSLISLEDPVSKQQMAARVEVAEYMPAHATTPPRLEISTKIIDANGDDFIYSNMVAFINEYDGAKLVSELSVKLLTPDLPLYKTLQDRGRNFVGLNGVHYMSLDGVLIINRGRDIIRVRSKTRVMVDCKAFREANPSYNHSFSGITLVDLLSTTSTYQHHYPRYTIHSSLTTPSNSSGSIPGTIAASIQPKDIKTVPEDELVLCSPTVFGYAFTEKAWVQMTVDGLSPIIWDTDAYNKLVLPDDTKKLVKSLVQACRTDTKLIKDIISTKGSGVVFVLHGDPGTGKTLTAEAIGEELRRPILVIAVSDLGTDPTNVEIRLGNYLRTAEKWDSIVLLDEADVFLEQRGRQDIFRNAMVGVFLRLLEYHNSPMFLTTNRVFAFDPAIRSRISIAIKYHPLKRIARKQVWQQLLEMANANISAKDLDEVSMSQVNGREIKNTIRSAQALAVADGTEMTMKHIKTVLDVQKEFREDFEGLPGLWNGMGVS